MLYDTRQICCLKHYCRFMSYNTEILRETVLFDSHQKARKSWWSVYIVIAYSLLPCKVYYFFGNPFQLNISKNTILCLQFTRMMIENFPQTCSGSICLFLLHYSHTSCADWQWTSTLWSDLWPYNFISKRWMI